MRIIKLVYIDMVYKKFEFFNRFKKTPEPPIDNLKNEISKLNFILIKSVIGITTGEIKIAEKIGLEIATKAFIEIKKGNRQLGWIKDGALKKIKQNKNPLIKYLEKDGNLDFYFNWCLIVGRNYGNGTPENIKKIKESLVFIKK